MVLFTQLCQSFASRPNISKQLYLTLHIPPVRYYVPVTSNASRELQNVTIQHQARGTFPIHWLSERHVGQLFTNSTFVAPPRGPGWWPDPLLQIGPTGVTVIAGQTTALWITVSVPSDAEPGNYSEISAVYSEQGLAANISFQLEVWRLQLPTLSKAAFNNFFQFQFQPHPFDASPSEIRGVLDHYYGPRTPQVKEKFFQFLCTHRVPPIGYTMLRNFSDMVQPLNPRQCTGTVSPVSLEHAGHDAGEGIPFSIMSISDLFGHRNPSDYTLDYLQQLWSILDPVVAALNRSGALPFAAVYGFDEAHPRGVYEPLVEQLFGAVHRRYGHQLKTMATLHYCPSLQAPIDILIQSYADYPNGTNMSANYGQPGQKDEFCPPGFPSRWASSASTRRYLQYHCFSPRSPRDNAASHPTTWPIGLYGAMNTFVDYPRIHSRILPWWAASNEGVSGWLYFETTEWRFDSGPNYPAPTPYHNHTHHMPQLPAFVRQPNDWFVDERLPGANPSTSRLTFNVNKYYANVYGGGTTAGDGVLLYPGRSGPVSGSRLESWRDGSEDAEIFLRLPLHERQRLIHQVVRSIGEWSGDVEVVERIRRHAAAAVMAIGE